jgi:anti-sigma28 factor (negative regulator of flagellin synthesis)
MHATQDGVEVESASAWEKMTGPGEDDCTETKMEARKEKAEDGSCAETIDVQL